MTCWVRESGGKIIYSDDPLHEQRVREVLRLNATVWNRFLEEYRQNWTPACDELDGKLQALGAAFRRHSPHEGELPQRVASVTCILCKAPRVTPVHATRTPRIIYGRCGSCGHGALLEGATSADVYQSEAYFRIQPPDGAGYRNYETENLGRQARAARLFRSIENELGTLPRRILEVGSGFGFARKAAEAAGSLTYGVDVNPTAARMTRKLFGMDTFVGDLGMALRSGAVEPRSWDLVLYQFVLEHLPDPVEELRLAATALAPGGTIALLVPNMDAAEIRVFGAAYRSFRADHLHVFSRQSLGLALQEAGLDCLSLNTTCSADLLAGFVDKDELRNLYNTGLGPDILLLARRREQ